MLVLAAHHLFILCRPISWVGNELTALDCVLFFLVYVASLYSKLWRSAGHPCFVAAAAAAAAAAAVQAKTEAWCEQSVSSWRQHRQKMHRMQPEEEPHASSTGTKPWRIA